MYFISISVSVIPERIIYEGPLLIFCQEFQLHLQKVFKHPF